MEKLVLSKSLMMQHFGCFRKGRWIIHHKDIEKIARFKIGQHVRFQVGVVEPRWGWRGAQSNSRGVIISFNADGEVRVAFFGLLGLWRGDPADLEIDQMCEVGDWVRIRSDARFGIKLGMFQDDMGIG
ncbi:hypothetical protein RHGRI_013664 [Rhododendron griersonianum]|uniref:Mind bomb SH3 repeat domain-containing protein n=1 Tax=Rhododendron griersonianum TaxID=479676 RepID=A0AAV6K6H0_9ERIC|nr:hypothetical protein RHGRI_013664 [Rhododendron griersonianum]